MSAVQQACSPRDRIIAYGPRLPNGSVKMKAFRRNLHEKVLKPSNVNAGNFGKLFSRTVYGEVFAQLLYVPSLEMPGIGKRNVIFAATEHDSAYAF